MPNQLAHSPRQAEAFWAEMRSTAYLFAKSTWPTQNQAQNLLKELRHILGKRIITYPQTFGEFGIGPETPYKLKKAFLGIKSSYTNRETEESEQRFMKFMANKAAQSQKSNWTWRITQEAAEKQEKGWYPFFITLTVDPKVTDPATLWKEGRELRKYIRRLANIAAAEIGHPPPHKKTRVFGYRPESDYVTYAGVIEHGKSLEHHHAHLMVWMREIPSLWKIDPNHGNPCKSQRECKPMRTLWPWAIASQKPALYFRSKGDIWSKLGFVTPIDDRNGQPIKINPVDAVGAYVTKYMQKGNKIWHHRMKCTRNLGLTKLNNLLDQLDLPMLEGLSMRPHHSSLHHSVSLIHSVPQGLIRSIAKRKLFAIRYQSKSLDLKTLMRTNYEHYKKMLSSVRDGVRPDRMPSADFYDWVQKCLPEQTEYCERRMLDSHRILGYDFPRKIHRTQPVVLGANEIGFTQCI